MKLVAAVVERGNFIRKWFTKDQPIMGIAGGDGDLKVVGKGECFFTIYIDHVGVADQEEGGLFWARGWDGNRHGRLGMLFKRGF